MSTDVTVETVVARPRDETAAYMFDWRNDPDWIGALTGVELVTPEPFGTGARVRRTASFLGRRVDYVNEVAELEPGRRLLMRSVVAPFPMEVAYELEDVDGGTLVRIRARGDASGFYRMAGPLLSLAVRRGIAGDLARLAAILDRR